MTKALKKLIEEAPLIDAGLFNEFLIVSNGEYNGFWGKNGFNNVMVFVTIAGEGEEDKWYRLSDAADKLNVYHMHNKPCSFNLDIPKKYGVPRIWFSKPVEVNYSMKTADIMGYVGGQA